MRLPCTRRRCSDRNRRRFARSSAAGRSHGWPSVPACPSLPARHEQAELRAVVLHPLLSDVTSAGEGGGVLAECLLADPRHRVELGVAVAVVVVLVSDDDGRTEVLDTADADDEATSGAARLAGARVPFAEHRRDMRRTDLAHLPSFTGSMTVPHAGHCGTS